MRSAAAAGPPGTGERGSSPPPQVPVQSLDGGHHGLDGKTLAGGDAAPADGAATAEGKAEHKAEHAPKADKAGEKGGDKGEKKEAGKEDKKKAGGKDDKKK